MDRSIYFDQPDKEVKAIEAMTLSNGELFISDLGDDRSIAVDGTPGVLGRYAVIKNVPEKGQYQVMEVGSDLQRLLEKYGLQKSSVGRIERIWK